MIGLRETKQSSKMEKGKFRLRSCDKKRKCIHLPFRRQWGQSYYSNSQSMSLTETPSWILKCKAYICPFAIVATNIQWDHSSSNSQQMSHSSGKHSFALPALLTPTFSGINSSLTVSWILKCKGFICPCTVVTLPYSTVASCQFMWPSVTENPSWILYHDTLCERC